jgi:hypothetical protein
VYSKNPVILYNLLHILKKLLITNILLQEMSYNNYLDADAAWNCVSEFDSPTCVVVKHTNPCGVASRQDILEAYKLAVKGDAVSAFGGIVAFNTIIDEVFSILHLTNSLLISLATSIYICYYMFRILRRKFVSSGVLQMVRHGCSMR